MAQSLNERWDELRRQGKVLEWCDYYEKPLKLVTEQELDHCRDCGDLCHFRGRACEYILGMAKEFSGSDWDDDWDELLNT